MANHIVLPQDADDARNRFAEILERPFEPIVLVLGDNDTATDADIFVQKIVRDNPNETSGFFGFVNFVIARDPSSIIEILEGLENKSKAKLDNLDNYVILSISPLRNIISDAITKKTFNAGKGSVSFAVLQAWKNK